MDLLMFLLGLVIGSFLGALTYRYPRNVSFAAGRSFCDRCKRLIHWYDNIPLISYLLIGGKCRDCGKKISVRYPLIELSTAIAFLMIGPNLLNLLLFAVLFSILIIDLEHQIIPDDFIFFGMLLALFIPGFNFFVNILSGLTASVFLVLIHVFTKGRGMGLGDVKFAILGGMIVGIGNVFIWLFMSFFLGAVAGIILIITKSAKLKDKIAFGPFLVMAIPIALIWSDRIIKLMGLR